NARQSWDSSPVEHQTICRRHSAYRARGCRRDTLASLLLSPDLNLRIRPLHSACRQNGRGVENLAFIRVKGRTNYASDKALDHWNSNGELASPRPCPEPGQP